jgi:hypothetical protein
MQAWLDPNIPFSLAHYWTRTSFLGADMRYVLFPPVVVDDPRPDTPPGGDARDRLVRAVLDQVTSTSDPDWDLFDQFLMCFAQPTDMFGGGTYALKTRPGSDRTSITGAVIDIGSAFDGICQEVGHAFGFQHERNFAGADYGCPYSVMSSSGQGSSFERPVDARLPVSVMPAGERADYFGPTTTDPQRVVGPYIPAVQFYVTGFGPFKHPDSIVQVPASYEMSPFTFRIEALDAAVTSWPQRRRVLAVLPPLVLNGDTFFLELRRRGGDYDQGITREGGAAPTAITIYSYHEATKLVSYQGRIALTGAPGDMDYHSFKGFFGVRLNSVDQDFLGANLTVGGGDFWKHFGVDLEEPAMNVQPLRSTEWAPARVAACFLWKPSEYTYRYHFHRTTVVLVATSLGYERPGYRWFVEDQELDPTGTTIDLPLQVRRADAGQLLSPEPQTVRFRYNVVQNRLELSSSEAYAGIHVSVRVIAGESSPEVIQSFYPDRTVWTGIGFDNIEIEWDARYQEDHRRCMKIFRDIDRRFSESRTSIVPIPDPGPRLDDRTVAVLQSLIQSNPAAASAAIDAVAHVAGISRLQVLMRM